MALVEVNGIGVVSADFVIPKSRAWHVDATISTGDASKVAGKVSISINDGALTLKGTARAPDAYLDTVRARIVAGAGGLGIDANPKFYRSPTVKIVLNDLLAAAGESLSDTADASVLGTTLAAWCVSRMPVGDAIGLLMDEVGSSWRLLADGTFWCGAESWPDSGLTFSLEHEDKAHSQVVVSMEAPLLLPGVSLDGRKVSYVETHVDADTVRSTAWIVTARSQDRLRDPVDFQARSSMPHVDYFGLYRCRVASQSADLTTLDLIPDDSRLSQDGAQEVPLRHGLPGCKVQVPAGTYVRLGWDNGDQSKPYCALWDGGESPQKIQLAGTHPLPLWDNYESAFKTFVTAMKSMINALVLTTGIAGADQTTAASACDAMLALLNGALDSQIVSNG